MVTIEADAQPGQIVALLKVFSCIAARRSGQDGFVRYDLHQDPEHPRRFVACEIWESQAARMRAIGGELDILQPLFEQMEALAVRPVKVAHRDVPTACAHRADSKDKKRPTAMHRMSPRHRTAAHMPA